MQFNLFFQYFCTIYFEWLNVWNHIGPAILKSGHYKWMSIEMSVIKTMIAQGTFWRRHIWGESWTQTFTYFSWLISFYVTTGLNRPVWALSACEMISQDTVRMLGLTSQLGLFNEYTRSCDHFTVYPHILSCKHIALTVSCTLVLYPK